MNKMASAVLLVLGLVLLGMGWDASRSVSSEVSRLFTGAPTDRTMALVIGGGILTVLGLGGMTRGPK